MLPIAHSSEIICALVLIPLLAALGGDYEESEIRLVRIKFLCEVAN